MEVWLPFRGQSRPYARKGLFKKDLGGEPAPTLALNLAICTTDTGTIERSSRIFSILGPAFVLEKTLGHLLERLQKVVPVPKEGCHPDEGRVSCRSSPACRSETG